MRWCPQYADFYFAFDGQRRVTRELIQGGSRAYDFSYSASTQPDGYNSWKTKIVETHPGGEQTMIYANYTDQTKQLITTYGYTFHGDSCRVQQKTSTLPVVSTDQRGSGTADSRLEFFDEYGNLTWQMDERGFLTRQTFDVVTGALIQRIDDVDTSQVDDAPAGWETPTGGGLHLVSDYTGDDLGREVRKLKPVHTVDLAGAATAVRPVTWIVHQDVLHEIWTAQGYATGASFDTFTLENPVSLTKLDANSQVLEQIQAVRSSTSGELSPDDSFPQSSYVRWTTNQYTDCCLLASTRVYHTIPASGSGSSGTNYDETVFGYDSSKRRNRQVTPGGTITRTVFDVRGNPWKIFVGTNDTGATESDPTGGGASGNNMVLVTEYEYDGGSAGGDNHLTQQAQYL